MVWTLSHKIKTFRRLFSMLVSYDDKLFFRLIRVETFYPKTKQILLSIFFHLKLILLLNVECFMCYVT